MRSNSKKISKAESTNQFAVEVFYHDDSRKNIVRDFFPVAVTPELKEESHRKQMYVVPESQHIDLAKANLPAAFGDLKLLDVVKKYCKKFELTLNPNEDPVSAHYMSASFLLAQTYGENDQPSTPVFSIPAKNDGRRLLIYFPVDGSSKIKTSNSIQQKITLDRACVVVQLEFTNKTVDYISVYALNPVIVDCTKEPDLDTAGEKKFPNRDKANKKLYERMLEQASNNMNIFSEAKAYTSDDFYAAINGDLRKRYQVSTSNTDHLLPALFHLAANLKTMPLCNMRCRTEYTTGVDLYFHELNVEMLSETLSNLKNAFGASVTLRNETSPVIRIPYAAVFANMHLFQSAADTLFSHQQILDGYREHTKKSGYGYEPDLAKPSRDELQAKKKRETLESSAKTLTWISERLQKQGEAAKRPLKKAKLILAKRLSVFAEKALQPECPQQELTIANDKVRQGIAMVEAKMDDSQVRSFKKGEKKEIKEVQKRICRGF